MDEYNNFKNGISEKPINSKNENNSLEDEYILELSIDEDDFKERLEEYNRECDELLKKAESASNNLDEEIDYIIKNAKKEIYIVKTIEKIIDREIIKNKKININLINCYLNIIKDNNFKIKKLLKFKSYNYKYKEIFLLKIAELEINNIKNIQIEDYIDINEKVNYILSILEQAELLSKNNGTKSYLLDIYLNLSELYNIDCEIKDQKKSNEYIEKAKRIKKEIEIEKKSEEKRINETATNKINSINKKEKNKILSISIIIISILIFANLSMYKVNSIDKDNNIQNDITPQNRIINNNKSDNTSENSNNNDKKVPKNPEKNSSKTISSRPTVKKSLPTRYSEYGDYDPDTQEYFMEIEDFLTQYYIDYEKAVSNSDYSYVSRDLVDDGQLSKELKISIPRYKNKSVYVKHFSIYNFDLYDNEASFNLDTVYVIDNERIQIETQRMTVYYDYYNQCWLIDNYTDWDIIYKQDYNPDEDYFDFTNYRDYF